MTAASIPASAACDYAEYLDGKTVAPQQGDYYLGPGGTPAEAPGRWIGNADALARTGATPGRVEALDLRALMAGRRPGEPESFLRVAGPNGTRAAGIDVTFSAPKSLSIAWALADPVQRREIEQAHHAAVERAVDYLRERVELSARWDPASRRSRPVRAAHLHTAEFLHTTARGVGASAPDPQIHSHVIITSAERDDGRLTAIRSRPLLRSAREGGAFYRAELAQQLRELGYEIVAAGQDGRYFRIAGISTEAEQAFSKRAAEVQQAARQFRADHGREPERGELRALALRTRSDKHPHTRHELDETWIATAAPHGLTRQHVAALRDGEPADAPDRTAGWRAAVELAVTAKRAVFDERELRTVALEQAAGYGLAPRAALASTDNLRAAGRVLDLADGQMTTALVREAETQIEMSFRTMSADASRHVSDRDREAGIAIVEQRLAAALSIEQRAAVASITGAGRAALLIGPAGTGKGVVIDAAAHSERAAGRDVYGVAVAGRTAQRLGESAPALASRVKTIDGFIASVEHGRTPLGENATVYVDEAGMADTNRLHRLTELVQERGGAIVAIGDPRQLPAIGAGGMFERLAGTVPTVELHEVHRASDPAELAAWSAMRDGNAETALDYYRAHGHVHLSDTRTEAAEQAAQAYDRLAAEHGHDRVALMSDASNIEIDHLNLRIQALRRARNELSNDRVAHPAGHHLHAGDRIIWTQPMAVPGAARVENGHRGQIVDIDQAAGGFVVALDGDGRQVTVASGRLDIVRLGYATHVVREQGATVRRSVVITGGWQTSQETAYVESTRATHGVDWHIARDDLDGDHDADRVSHLARRMSTSRAQTPSLASELIDHRRASGDPHQALHIERLAAAVAEPALDTMRDRTPGLEP
ncbi:MobF family relaxase [Conexibacter sp. JD483]|uniref:MobF family relaxase n=1 Tax=unclassified Conexibacter TaxID=2627773 RepID=UPI00272321B3|nr:MULTISPECIES: MobF family relaxase [unclassified Conexibacter]MDO8184645.1 MobF family relaxase [Conexibacter sp. CPCC 205706]MDO8197951.1 MobF family relaxase [Conexibacter sp. CPCC 205762]MDR9368381.1 MobF family relaxase [Conexibacter sp. JD483]